MSDRKDRVTQPQPDAQSPTGWSADEVVGDHGEGGESGGRVGWSTDEVVGDRNDDAPDTQDEDAGWSGSEVVGDRPDRDRAGAAGWSGDEVVKDQDQVADADETAGG